MEVLEYGPVGSGVASIPVPNWWLVAAVPSFSVGFSISFSMTFGPSIWSSRSGCCYLCSAFAVSRKPNVHFKRHRESLMLNILSMTIALNISLSLCRHCWIACECCSSRSRNDQFWAHPIYVISLARNDILNHNGKCDVHTVSRICFLKYRIST